jgi:acetylornithine deacetylase/succinyl-diaminopimelate desuccinylase-like protein
VTNLDDAARAAKKRRHRNERIAAAILILILSAGAYMLHRWNEAEREALRSDRRYLPKDVTITPEVEMLREYVRIDTSTPKGIAEGARWLAAELGERGIQAELIASAPDYLNVYARIRGRTPGEGLILFNHIDVVPPGNGWKHPPFEAKVSGDELYGRGALDMKALAICQLLAFADVARRGKPPEHDLVFLATAEEEKGSALGMRWLVANRPDIFEGIRYGITEGGITEVMSERMTYFGIEVAGKQAVQVKLTADGPEPLRRARLALEPYMRSREEPARIPQEVREYFHAISPSRVGFGPLLADIDATVARGDYWKLPASYRDMTQNTLWMTGAHIWRGRWTVVVQMFNLPDEDPQKRIAWLRQRVAPFDVELEVQQVEGPVPSSRRDTMLFRILAETAREQYRTDAGPQILYRSASDARILRPRGIECYGLCPYPVSYFESLTIHKSDERIRVHWFLDGIRYTRTAIGRWAFPAAAQ